MTRLTLIERLCRLRDRIGRHLCGDSVQRGPSGRLVDPWDVGYRAGHDAVGERADCFAAEAEINPHPPRTAAALSWREGFMIGFCESRLER